MSELPAKTDLRSNGDLPRRAVTVAIGISLVAAAVAVRWGLLAFLAAATFLAGWECQAVTAPGSRRVAKALAGSLTFACAGLCLLLSRVWPPGVWILAGSAVLAFGSLLVPWSALDRFAGSLYFGALPAFLVLLRQQGEGGAWVAVTLAATWGGETAAFVVGRTVGRRPLAPGISPAKTVEGAVGGLAGGTLLALLVAVAVRDSLPFGTLAWAAPASQVLSQLGDLAESRWKRLHGVKDSGRWLGSQGGVLDCMDGLCLAAPFMVLVAARTPEG